MVSAHNVSFEYAIWNEHLAVRFDWPKIPIEQFTDTAARAARCGLPRALEKAAKSMGLSQQKDMAGSKNMKRMAKPRKTHIVEHGDSDLHDMVDLLEEYQADPFKYTPFELNGQTVVYEWWCEPDRVEKLGDYCDQDIRTQTEMELALPELSTMEREVWLVTMRANIRGCLLDTKFIRRAMSIISRKLASYASELMEITGGQVSSHTDLNGMKRFITGQGVPITGFDKNVVAALLADTSLPPAVHRVAVIRSEAGKSSVAKFPAMKLHSSNQGIANDQLVYYGAISTGRWSALGFQLHNLPARGAVSYEEAEWCIYQINSAKNAYDVVPGIEAITGLSIIEVLSMCLRGVIKARAGMKIVCADYSNIEGRVSAWFGDEQWKLDAFRAYDEGRGPDLYKVTAGQILGKHPDDINKVERNVLGKVSELALGFQGGVGAFVSMGSNYGIDMRDYADIVQSSLPDDWETAVENYEGRGKGKSDLTKAAWCASEGIKLAWRGRHPGIQESWYDAEAAAISALESPGTAHRFCGGKLAMLSKSMWGKQFLLLRLPSGRCIYYANAKLRDQVTPWGKVKKQVMFDKVEQGRIIPSSTYGGDLFQSAVQGTARDLMAYGWISSQNAGFEGLFSVHDELASEVPALEVDLEEYERILCNTPEWAKGCPVTASGYVSDRFRKD